MRTPSEDWAGLLTWLGPLFLILGFLFAFAEPRRPDTLNVKTVGVVPGHTGRGVASLLAYHAYRAALRRGVCTALLCLMRHGNPSRALAGGAGRVFREYALYGRTTDELR